MTVGAAADLQSAVGRQHACDVVINPAQLYRVPLFSAGPRLDAGYLPSFGVSLSFLKATDW